MSEKLNEQRIEILIVEDDLTNNSLFLSLISLLYTYRACLTKASCAA